jgi:hypothetical protein
MNDTGHTESASRPKRLRSAADRRMARETRDAQWTLMERVANLGTLWFCVWNKARLPQLSDEMRCGLIDGLEYLEWIDSHSDWWIKGKWDDARYAFPLQLTDAGRIALADRDQYDMEPVTGGLVEPGWICTPAARTHRTDELVSKNTGEQA